MSITSPPPRILSIAGSDSSGGAGIQADIKTIVMMGGFAMTAITAVTAQNSLGVTGVETLSPDMVAAQIDACVSDIGVDAVKVGMLGSAAIAHVVADRLEGLSVPVVFDPVMISTSGAVLADAETISAFERLIRIAALTTPNLPELEALVGFPIEPDEMALACAAEAFLIKSGGAAVLAKGGHWPGGRVVSHRQDGTISDVATEELVFDCLYARSPEGYWSEWVFDHARVDTPHTHGTGCTLSSAIAVSLGNGVGLAESVKLGGEFVWAALNAAPGYGAGHGPMGHHAVRL
jgi:hydroxymethylpyrimidine/phosphomethylpyrimidine kinase